MPEWKVLSGNDSDVQRTLNQWRHLYHIHIHGVSCSQDGYIIILLTREKLKDA